MAASAVQAGLSAFIIDGFGGEHLEWEVELDDADQVRGRGPKNDGRA